MTERTKAVSIALLALASAAEAFGATLRTIVKRELIPLDVEGVKKPPCSAPEFVDLTVTPEMLDAVEKAQQSSSLPPLLPPSGYWLDSTVSKILDTPLHYGRPPSTQTTPAPDALPVIEFNDTASGDLWLIDEVGNVTRNGAVVYLSRDDPARMLSLIGSKLWFRTSQNRWFSFDGSTPVLQSDKPGA